MSAISVSWLNVSWGAVYIETNYGLMQHSYIEIKNKLLRALDSEYNVVDMATVFEVVSLLEKTPITPEILEKTRLGKVINECRRRTNNEVLAKRAKLLLRHWRNMMIAPAAPETQAVSVNSQQQQQQQQQAINRNSSSNIVFDNSKISPSSSSSPGLDPKVESVPKTHVANKRLRKNAGSPPALGEPPSKISKMNGVMLAAKKQETNAVLSAVPSAATAFEVKDKSSSVSDDSPLSSRVPRDATLPVFRPAQHTAEDDEDENCETDGGGNALQTTVVTQSVPEPDPPLPKRRSRKKAKKKLLEEDIVKEKLVAMSKTVRVKTTEELVAELKSRTEDRLLASTSDTSLECSKPSVKPSLSNDIRGAAVEKGGKYLISGSAATKSFKEERLDPETRMEREIAEIMSKLPPLDLNSIRWDSSPEPCSAPSTPRPITEEDLDRYLNREWDGVNGCTTEGVVATTTTMASDDGYDGDGERGTEETGNNFREWHKMVARKTLNDDLIHILPYSIVD